MLAAAVEESVSKYVRALERQGHPDLEAVYLVGGSALGDFSDRQSNIDLVVVTASEPAPADRAGFQRAERALERVGRPPGVWYATWDDIADGSPAGVPGTLDTPMTRCLLTEEAIAVTGPDWPVVAYDQGVFQGWCRGRLKELLAGADGLMVMRREVVPLVLEAARLAEGAVTGRVLSRSQAGEEALALVPNHYRRILNDAVGYRRGANTSNYWGPFERKADARQVIRLLVEAATA